MLTLDRLISTLFSGSIQDVRSAYIARVREEQLRTASLSDQLQRLGFEEIDQETVTIKVGGNDYTNDGRIVIHSAGKAWAIDEATHKSFVTESLEAAKTQSNEQSKGETKSVVGTESLSAMVCPKCGDSLQHASVCPKCAAGRLGYRHRYTCVCGGVDMVSKEAL